MTTVSISDRPDLELRRAIAQALADFAAAWPRQKIDATALVDVYVRGVSGVPIASIRPAVDRLLQRDARYAPSPGALRQECLAIAEQRGLSPAYAAAPTRPVWVGLPEDACPACGRAASVVAEWTPGSRLYDRARQRYRADRVQYRVTSPPACACWNHVIRTTCYRALEWLTPEQRAAADQWLEPRLVPDDDEHGAGRPSLAAMLAALTEGEGAPRRRRMATDGPWLTDETRPTTPDDAVRAEQDADADREVA